MFPVHLEIVQGTPFRLLVRVNDVDEAGEKTPKSLAGSTIRLQTRRYIDSPNTLIDLSTETGGIELGEDVGSFVVEMSAEETRNLRWPSGLQYPIFQCEVEPPDDDSFRALEGTMSLNQEVVR